MQVPSLNAVGGTLTAIALVALVVMFGHGHKAAPVSVTPPVVSTVKPVSPPKVLKSAPDAPTEDEAPAPKKPTYHRLVPHGGGKLGKQTDCKWVPSVAHQYTQAQVLAAAKQYGLSPAQIEALRVCLN